MSFNECVEQLNWLSILIILICAGLVDYFIGAQKDKKIMSKFESDIHGIHEIKQNLKELKDYVIKRNPKNNK